MGETELQLEGLLLAQADEAAPEDAAPEEAAPGEDHGEGAVIAGEHAEAEHAEEAPIAELALALALIIVVVFAYRPVKRAILAMLDGRSEQIRTDLSEAQKLREEAQAALASYQRRQRDAMEEAERIIAHAREEAEAAREQALKDLDAQLKRREQLAMERIAQAEQAAAAEVRNAAVDVAVAAARQVLRERLDEKSAAALIDSSIEDLSTRLH